MPQSQLTPLDSPHIDRPGCPKCGSKMWLARIAPDGSGSEKRTFECPVCDISEATEVKSN